MTTDPAAPGDEWNTTGRLSGCAPWDGVSTPSAGHSLDCECPPYTCNDCGQSRPQREPCACFVSLEGMNLADLKALFSDDEDGPGLSLDVRL
jgi:hypothetical protein